MVERSENGLILEPQLQSDELREETGLSDQDIVDGVDELEGDGLIEKHVYIDSGEMGFSFITPKTELFVKLDPLFKGWNPADDALLLATDMVSSQEDSFSPANLAEKYGWPPRRLNTALNYLIGRDIVDSFNAIGTGPWTTYFVRKTPKTRRFVRDRSQA